MGNFAKIEDIMKDLNLDLLRRGDFYLIDAVDDERVRYAKSHSPIDFQVGIEENLDDEEEPEFNHIYLAVGYNLPEDVNQHVGERTFPNPELMHQFFRDSPIYHQSLTFNEDRFKNGRMNLVYHIGFEKSKTSVEEMNRVLTEVIDYFCNYTTTNIEMLNRTRAISQSSNPKSL